MADFDLDAYLERIGFEGSVRITEDTLGRLLAAHMARIPFENLDVLLGRPLRLDVEALQQKLVVGRRGGYCFEHATLLGAALARLGFEFVAHSARVTLWQPPSQVPRTHMFLIVAVNATRFVLDPGFGTLAPRVPVPLVHETRVRAGDEVHWMAQANGAWALRALLPEGVRDCWVSTLDPDYPVDFEMANHFTATHPASAFVNRMMLRALTPTGRVTVMNRDVTVTDGASRVARELDSRAELRELVVAYFGFDLPELERLRVPSIPEWA